MLPYDRLAPYDFRNKQAAIDYFVDSMLNKTLTMFRYKKLPETIPERDLELILQVLGSGIITENKGELLALWGGFTPPLNAYYRPTKVIVTNPWAEIDKTFTIDEDCILVRNDPLERGLLPILNKYGSMTCEGDITMLLALINFRALFAITAADDDDYASANEFLKQIEAGELGAMMSASMKEAIGTQPFANNSGSYLTQVIEMQQYIKGSFYQEIGLNSNYNMKRERLSESEAGLNRDVLRPLIDSMLEERQKAMDKVNKMFGTDISVEFNSSWTQYNEDETPTEEITTSDKEIEEVVKEKEITDEEDKDSNDKSAN